MAFSLKKSDRVEKQNARDAQKVFSEGMTSVLDIIAPAVLIINPNEIQLGEQYVKTLFVYTYPRYLQSNWLSSIIDYDITMDISMFVNPLETRDVMDDL